MSRSVVLKGVQQRGQYWRLRYGKTELSIPGTTAAHLRQWIREQLDESEDFAMLLALACIVKQDPTLAGLQAAVGKTITISLDGSLTAVNSIVRVA